MMVVTVIGAGVGSAVVLLAVMLVSWRTRYRVWPPGGDRGRQLVYWLLASANITGFFIVLQAQTPASIGLTPIDAFGATMILIGLLGTVTAVRDLGTARTAGDDNGLVTDGLYRYSRNPQILANLAVIVGVVLLVPTQAIIVLSAITAAWLTAMVMAEEQWLKEEDGDTYRDYMETTPRFI